MSIRITCINKSGGWHEDPHAAISNLGWINEENHNTGKNTRIEVYDWLKENPNQNAYVLDRFGNKAYVSTRENAYGTKFLQTYADKVWTNNLLHLPECVA